jgi:hypothetical protein
VNWLASRVMLRVRTVPEVLDLGLVFLVENWKPFARVALAVLVVPFAACVVLQFRHFPWWEIWAVAIVLGAIAQGAFTAAAGQLLFADRLGLRPMLAPFGRRLFPFLMARLNAAIVLGIVSPFILPIPAVGARIIFFSEYCLLEAASPFQCFRRGGQLTRRQTARSAILSLLLLGSSFAFAAFADQLGHSLVEFVFQLGRPVGSLFSDGGSTYALAGYFLSIPYVAAARFLAYVDSRTRMEGWDIQVRFASLQQRAASEEAAA